MNLAIDHGAPFRDSVMALVARHPEFEAEIRDWADHWIEMATPDIPLSVRLLRALRARGVPVHALSNFGVETFGIARAHHPFLDEFDRHFLSGEMRIAKPDPAISAAVEEALGVAGPQILFTDDRPDNVAAAAARGWRTHLFETPEGLAERLVAEGLLPAAEAA